jgi:hypothetical protein
MEVWVGHRALRSPVLAYETSKALVDDSTVDLPCCARIARSSRLDAIEIRRVASETDTESPKVRRVARWLRLNAPALQMQRLRSPGHGVATAPQQTAPVRHPVAFNRQQKESPS